MTNKVCNNLLCTDGLWSKRRQTHTVLVIIARISHAMPNASAKQT